MEKEENNLTIPTYLQGLLDASSQGMDTLSHSLSKLLDFPVLVVTHTYEIISSSFFNQNLGEIQVESVVPYEAKNFWFVCTVTSNTKHSKAIGRGITSSDHVIGYLFVLIDDQHLDEAKLTPILDYSASLYATHVQSRKELINEQYRLKNAFLYDMLYGNIKINEDIISMGEIWGLDFRIQHAVLVFILTDFDVHTSDEYLMDNLRLIVERATADLNNKNSAIMVRRNEIILFSPVEDCQSGDKKRFFFRLAKSILAHSMESELQNRVACGIGKTYPFPVDLFRSYQEAKVACEMGRL